MATQVIFCSTKLPEPNGSPISGSHFDAVDTKMTSSLISVDGSSSQTPKSLNTKMDSFRSSRERNERMNRSNPATTPRFTGHAHDAPGRQPSIHNQDVPEAASHVPLAVSNDGYTPITFFIPGHASIPPEQLESAYAYGIQRANGVFTRLIPADVIPADVLLYLSQIPQHQGPEGLIILPQPRAASPMVHDSIGSRLPNSYHGPTRANGDQGHRTQLTIDTILASNSPPKDFAPSRMVASKPMTVTPTGREKVYCDKWVHEGICAFTQKGCKYKHEMPMDSETQNSLGLRGIPQWYQRKFGNTSSPPKTMAPVVGAGLAATSWRPQTTTYMPRPITSQENASFGTRYDRRNSFGPIGPPTPSSSHPSSSHRCLTTPSQSRESNPILRLLENHDRQESDNALGVHSDVMVHGNSQGNHNR